MSTRSRARSNSASSIISNMSSRSRSQSARRQPSLSAHNTLKVPRSQPGSRSSSPSAPSRRVAKLNMYLARSAACSTADVHHMADAGVSLPRALNVKIWDGNCRTTKKWDSIRRDPELWFSSGDCLVFLYEQGSSRRGASLKVSLADMEASNCGPLLERCYGELLPNSAGKVQESIDLSDPTDIFHDLHPLAQHGLFIPAPADMSREEAFQYHLTTRNFFAWLVGEPLAGDRLGCALTSLLDRMNEYRPNPQENQDDVLAYMDDQGYTDFRDCPDHALAVLQFAEHFQLRDLWTDAFVHCAGMNDQLDMSGEFEFTPRASKALITRANLEMDVRLERAGELLSNFLEDDLSGVNLGLGKEAHLHLERFRSFLHSHYVGRHCYWPPPSPVEDSISFPQSVYRSLYFDFRKLYSYLVDQSSGTTMQTNKPVDGGICVFQNIQAFDKRNKYAALPHPLPMVPKVPSTISNRKRLGKINIFGSRKANFDRRLAAWSALENASNTSDPNVTSSSLVQDYIRFEKIWTMKEDQAVSCADARKVRWILIYAILQTLISVTQVPTEVRDTEGVKYPLCCQTAGTPPWTLSAPVGTRKEAAPSRPKSLRDQILELGPDMDIVSAKPSPLLVPKPVRSRTASPSRRLSLTQKLSLLTPKRLSRATSLETLPYERYLDGSPVFSSRSNNPRPSPINNDDQSDVSISPLSISSPQPITTAVDPLPTFPLPTISPGPLEHTSTFTLPIPHHTKSSEPSTPSTSEHNSSPWSSSRSNSEDDEMEHKSVNSRSSRSNSCSDLSVYSDDVDIKTKSIETTEAKQSASTPRPVLKKSHTSPAIPTRSSLRPVSRHHEEETPQPEWNTITAASTTTTKTMTTSFSSSFEPEAYSNPELESYLVS